AGPGPEAPGGAATAPETASTSTGPEEPMDGTNDPYLWLEEVDGGEALAWAEQHNAATRERLASDPLFAELHAQALAALTSPSRLPAVELRAGRVYDLWQDAAHPRGLWRSASQESFRAGNPDWQT